MWKACAFANAARNGVFAADLARRGMSGPHEIFEGPKGIFKMLADGPFEPRLATEGDYMITQTYIKYWPAEYHSQSAIDAALQLREQIDGRPIRSIEIGSFEAAVSIIGSEPEKWRPTSRETADHSMGYCVVCALIDGDVTRESFTDEKIRDPKYLAMLDKIKIYEEDELNAGYPKGIPNHLKITLEDGTLLEKRIDFPRGHAGNPMSDEEVVAKFKRNAQTIVTDQTAEQIIELCWKLDTLDDIGPLLSFDVVDD
jgi:2-methylcitrate dehydratase